MIFFDFIRKEWNTFLFISVCGYSWQQVPSNSKLQGLMRLFHFTSTVKVLIMSYTLLKMLRLPKESLLTKVLSAGLRSPENKILNWVQTGEKASFANVYSLYLEYTSVTSITYSFICSFNHSLICSSIYSCFHPST